MLSVMLSSYAEFMYIRIIEQAEKYSIFLGTVVRICLIHRWPHNRRSRDAFIFLVWVAGEEEYMTHICILQTYSMHVCYAANNIIQDYNTLAPRSSQLSLSCGSSLIIR